MSSEAKSGLVCPRLLACTDAQPHAPGLLAAKGFLNATRGFSTPPWMTDAWGDTGGWGGAPPDPEHRCSGGWGRRADQAIAMQGSVESRWGQLGAPATPRDQQRGVRKREGKRGHPAARRLCRGPCPPHSLIELGGSAQRLPDVRRQVPGVLRGGPGQLLALGMVHVADVVQRPRLPNLRVAPRLGDLCRPGPQGAHCPQTIYPLKQGPGKGRSPHPDAKVGPEPQEGLGGLMCDDCSLRTPQVTESQGRGGHAW